MKLIQLTLLLFLGQLAFSQNKLHTEDVVRFWNAYDKIIATDNYHDQLQIIQKEYLQPASAGLKQFAEILNYTDSGYINSIRTAPHFWKTMRQNTLTALKLSKEVNASIDQLKKNYPELKPAALYFVIGLGNSGGKPIGNDLVIGLEVAAGDSTVNTSELKSDFLKKVFARQEVSNIISLAIHEYIHTQQVSDRHENNYILKQALIEGSCDFLAELITGIPLKSPYMEYGKKNAEKVKADFRKDLVKPSLRDWFYNGTQAEVGDLGYYVGYTISKKYYEQIKNKKEAIKTLISLNYSDDEKVFELLNNSKYFNGSLKYADLKAEINKRSPRVAGIHPIKADRLSAAVTEIEIEFTQPMREGYSINYSDKGKDFFPITRVIGYSDDKKKLKLGVKLEPDKEYQFVITNRSFVSEDGYALQAAETLISFITY
ncbi:DUF2268 domain-containing putative Zn-dependent protease [Gynurincola endophyticus]|uniref:DUF2268 domain-containing putative Zn-dependent protease n=1 Tax=Gynurincola endophyticus TaxID=2479004 RepID=UPI000F8C4BA0|nr:DUF2268 domain-containing putative Zn-dependent protease [Gynurincola endophyticus]